MLLQLVGMESNLDSGKIAELFSVVVLSKKNVHASIMLVKFSIALA